MDKDKDMEQTCMDYEDNYYMDDDNDIDNDKHY